MNAYILLTPTGAGGGRSLSMVEPARDLVERKWAAAAKQLARAASMPFPKGERESPRDASPTETDRSSDVDSDEDGDGASDGGRSDAESSEADAEAGDGDEDEDGDGEEDDEGGEFGAVPTYVCEQHDPRPILIAEHVPCCRVRITPFDAKAAAAAAAAAAKSNGQRPVRSTSAPHAASSSRPAFKFEISVGRTQGVFECSPSKALSLYRALVRDRAVGEQLRFLEPKYLDRGLVAALKRFYAAPHELAHEVRDVLESLADIDAVLLHPRFQALVGAAGDSTLRRELERLVRSHTRTPRSDPESKCMCDTYATSVERFGEFYEELAHPQPVAVGAGGGRLSTVASESLITARGVLSFYMDTVYVLDKRAFRPTHGLKKCCVYGFGRRKLFEVERVARKEWALRYCGHGANGGSSGNRRAPPLYLLTLEKRVRGLNTQPMVALKRRVPDASTGLLRDEDVGFVRKSRRAGGYRCVLMAEVMAHGRVATSISIVHPTSPEGDPNAHYVTMSELAGAPVCSSTLSVPSDPHKHVQSLHVGGGSDVLAFLALAVSYDLLASPIKWLMDRAY